MGASVGLCVGARVGITVGLFVGDLVGACVESQIKIFEILNYLRVMIFSEGVKMTNFSQI